MKLPEAFVNHLAERLGPELPAFLACYDQPARRGLRLNPRKPVPPTALPPGLGEPIPWEPLGRFLDSASPAGLHPLHEAGAWYLQEPSAMLPARVLAPRPGERVLDLCAAPGGKSTQLAALMDGQGLLVANEPVAGRAQILARNLERMGVPNALAVSALPQELARRWPEAFDAVLVDAPCSGEGMFRRLPESRETWEPQAPAGCAQRQAEILDAAAQMVRPGGRLVYATCTFERAENEDTVEAFLRRRPDFSRVPFSLPGAEAPDGLWTCYPHRTPGEGQFAALLTRAGDAPCRLPEGAPKAAPRAICEALAAAFPGAVLPARLTLLGETLTAVPEGTPPLDGLRVLRCGLHLGFLKGRVFCPDHAWAVCGCPPEVPRVPLDEAAARRYLTGETLPVNAGLRGWALPTLAGIPLGWGKATGGVLKNHYPKGLRRSLDRPAADS